MSLIIAIGNPGSGKSTILNSFAGQLLFKSGVSIGSGLTKHLESRTSNGITYIDTPGVADDTNKKAAGEALKSVFHRGGPMKILFFVTQQSGRIVVQDIATMKLVLESVPDIGSNYGIVVNKIPQQVMEQLSNLESTQNFILSLFTGIKDEFKHNHVLLVPVNKKMESTDNVLLDAQEIHPSLRQFLNLKVPEVNITPGKFDKINVDEFERLTEQIEEMEAELKRNTQQQAMEKENLVLQLQKAEEKRKLEEEENHKRHQEELKKLEREIHDAEQKKINAKRDAEIDHLNNQIQQMKKMHAHQQEMLNQQHQFLVEQQRKANEASSGNPFMEILGGVVDAAKSFFVTKLL